MRPYPRPNTRLVQPAMAAGARFKPVMHLLSGDPLGLVAEAPIEFEERVSFGPVTAPAEARSPAKWLARSLETFANAAGALNRVQHPLLVPAPLASLADMNSAAACDAAVRRTALCAQEFCLVFPDAAFAGDPADCTARLARLRRCGFRVGIDMRWSWKTPLDENLRILIDTIRVAADGLETSQDLADIALTARGAGILVVADNAGWRDGPYLDGLGVAGAVAPRADA